MIGYVVKRLFVAVPTLLLLTVVSFLLMRLAPGSPFMGEKKLPARVLANIEAKYGFDQPLWWQFADYLWGIVSRFDFGPSFIYPDQTVSSIIAAGFPVTLTYGALSFAIAVLVGSSLGIVAAIRHNGWLDHAAVGLSIGAQVLPNFVMAPLLVLLFTLALGWLPGGGWSFSNPATWVMPVIALSTSYMASIARITRSSMLEVLHSDFIRTARAKGLPEHRIILGHALKPALLPVVTYLGPTFVVMITGSMIVDSYFSTGGIGRYFVTAAFNRDYSVMLGITILVGALTIGFNLLVDVLYAWIDPRIRY